MVYIPCRNKLFQRILFLFAGTIFVISFMQFVPIPQRFSFSIEEPLILNLNQKERRDANPNADTQADAIISAQEEEEEWQLDNENIPDLPIILGNSQNGPKGYSPKCARFPDLYTVQFSNVHWQIQETEAETYYFYSAYLDMRGAPSPHPHHPYDNAHIRILTMIDLPRLTQTNATLQTCQFWFENTPTPVFGNITEVRMLWNYLWGNKAHYFPYLLTCKLPPGLKQMPISLSLTPTKCSNATNNLHILHRDRAYSPSRRVPQKEFGVCVKALDFPDASMKSRLIEWIEALRLLGADKILFYEYFVDDEIKKILNHYESRGIIGVTQTTLPGELPNQPQLRHLYIRGRKLDKRLTELIPYNDCFYKNMYDYKYIAVVDTDEIIIPSNSISWSDLLKTVKELDIPSKSPPVTTFCFQNFYFLDGMLTEGHSSELSQIPPDFHMLRHIYRSSASTGRRYMKCFHSTQDTLGVHNHFAFFCREGRRCNRHYIDVKRAQMNHYRSTCVKEIKNCSLYLTDTDKDIKLWRHKDAIIERVKTVLNLIK